MSGELTPFAIDIFQSLMDFRLFTSREPDFEKLGISILLYMSSHL